MNYESFGNGAQTIVLVHGGPSLYGYMMSLGEHFKEDFKVIDYVQRGCSESDLKASSDLLSIFSHIEDLDSVINALLLESPDSPICLLGHSWGANLALIYASKYSDKLDKVICVSTASLTEEIGDLFSENCSNRLSEEDKEKLEQINQKLENSKSESKINEIMNERLGITGPAYHYDRKTEEKLPVCKWNFHSFRDSIDSLWDLIEDGKIPGLLNKLTCPVYAFHGDSDLFPSAQTFEFLDKNINKLETHLIKKAGHFPWLEETSEAEFLEKIRYALK